MEVRWEKTFTEEAENRQPSASRVVRLREGVEPRLLTGVLAHAPRDDGGARNANAK